MYGKALAAATPPPPKGIQSGLFDKLKEIFGGEKGSPVQAPDLGTLITFIVQLALVVAASVAVIFLIVGGFKYITARGNEEKSEAAKKSMEHAVWGLVVITLSFAVVRIISEILLRGLGGVGI